MSSHQLLDLGTLTPGPTGRQNDAGVIWPTHFELLGVIPVPLVQERNGRLFFLDPEGVRAGQAEIHRWLIAVADLGTITDQKTVQDRALAEIRSRLTTEMARALAAVAAELPAELATLAPKLVALAVRALVGGR